MIPQSKLIRGKFDNPTKCIQSLLIFIDNAAFILKEIIIELERHVRIIIWIVLTVSNKSIEK
jgi:hypothetical protein